MSTKQASTSTSTSTPAKGLNKGDLSQAAAKAEPKLARVQPWSDLEASKDGARIPRENTTMSVALKTIAENNGRTGAAAKVPGATLDEIQEAFKSIEMGHHNAKQLLTWMNKNRGWGFKMDVETQRITAHAEGTPKAGR